MANWLRLETEMAFAGWTSRLPNNQYAAWVKILQIVKVYGDRGSIAIGKLADHAKHATVSRRLLTDTIAQATASGAIEQDNGVYSLPSWRKYQKDPTVTERVARHRAKDVTDVTVTRVGNDDTTLRDTTLHSPLPPSGGEGASNEAPPDPDIEIGGVGPPPRGPAVPPQVQAFRLLWTKAFCHDNPALTPPPKRSWLEAAEGWEPAFVESIRPEDLRAAKVAIEPRFWGPNKFLDWLEKNRRARSPTKPREQKPLDSASAFALLPQEAREPWLAKARASLSGRSPPRGMEKWPESTVATEATELWAAEKGA